MTLEFKLINLCLEFCRTTFCWRCTRGRIPQLVMPTSLRVNQQRSAVGVLRRNGTHKRQGDVWKKK